MPRAFVVILCFALLPLFSRAENLELRQPLAKKALCAFTKEDFRNFRINIGKSEKSDAIYDGMDLNSKIILKYFPELLSIAKSLADNLFSGLPSREGSATLVLKDQETGLVLTASHTAEAEGLTKKMRLLSVDYVAVPFKEFFDRYMIKSINRSEMTGMSSITNQYLVDTPDARRTDITIDFPAELIYKPAFKMGRHSSYGFYTDYENIPVALDFSLALVPLDALHRNHLSSGWAKENDIDEMKKKYPELYRGLMGVKPLEPRELKLSHFSTGPVFVIKDGRIIIGWGELQDSGEIIIDVPVQSGVSGSGLFDCRGDFAGIAVRSTQEWYIDSTTGNRMAKTIAVSLPLLKRSLLEDLEKRQIDASSYFSEFPLVKRLIEQIQGN